MRLLPILLVALVLPTAAAGDLYDLFLDWREGRSLVPTTPFVTPPTADAFAFEPTACHPHLVLDLLYDPAQLALDVSQVGRASIAYEFRIEVHDEDGLVLEKRVRESRYGHALGKLTHTGPHELRVSLAWGADIAWEARLRGRFAGEDPTCNPPL